MGSHGGEDRGLRFVAPRKVGEHDVLYGSVTSGDIAEFLKGKGIQIDKRKVLLDEPIKHLGEHEVQDQLHPRSSPRSSCSSARKVRREPARPRSVIAFA